MTNQDICNAATYLCGEIPANATDYAARAVPALALIYNDCAALDTAYRKSHDLPDSTWVNSAAVNMADLFPLADVFVSAVTYALGSMVVVDENAELSNLLYARFVADLDEIRRMIPAVPEPIADHYHLF